MKTYTKCIVAFLDILGFKSMINTKAFDEIMNIFLSIIPENELQIALRRWAEDTDTELLSYNDILSKTKLKVMSDSIVVAAPSCAPEALAVVVDICSAVQQKLYDLDRPVFVRGAISEGDFYLDENLMFGKGLIDAYLAQEHYAAYPRIIVSDAIITGKKSSVDSQDKLPRDEDGYCYINTLEQYFQCSTLEELKTNVNYNRIKECIDIELSGYADQRIREKYIWLRKELARIEKKIAWENGVWMLP